MAQQRFWQGMRPQRAGWAIASGLLLAATVACQTAIGEPSAIAAFNAEQTAVLEALRAADAIYLGEQHDRAADQAAQLAIVQTLHAAQPKLAIALEMFQHPFQPALDRYLAGEIDEAELLEQSEYEQRWGFPWETYAPLLRFAKAHQLPVLALNAPSEVTRQVSRQGLASLDAAARAQIPPLDELDLSNDRYRRLLREALEGHAAHGSLDLDNFFAAQIVWDETMAANIAAFHRANPDYQIVVVTGRGHVIYGYGIPDRVARRLGPDFVQRIVLLNPPPDLATDGDRAPADFIWRNE